MGSHNWFTFSTNRTIICFLPEKADVTKYKPLWLLFIVKVLVAVICRPTGQLGVVEKLKFFILKHGCPLLITDGINTQVHHLFIWYVFLAIVHFFYIQISSILHASIILSPTYCALHWSNQVNYWIIPNVFIFKEFFRKRSVLCLIYICKITHSFPLGLSQIIYLFFTWRLDWVSAAISYSRFLTLAVTLNHSISFGCISLKEAEERKPSHLLESAVTVDAQQVRVLDVFYQSAAFYSDLLF